MKVFSHSFFRIACVLLLPLLCSAVTCAQEVKMEVGDTIEVQIAGSTVTTTISGFTNVGWVKFNVNRMGTDIEFNMPKSKVVLIRVRVAEFREWKSKGGGFSVTAKLKKHTGSVVTLEDKKGKELKTQLSKLSDADRAYVKEFKKPLRIQGGSNRGGFGGPGSSPFGGGRASGIGNSGMQLPPGIELPPGIDLPPGMNVPEAGGDDEDGDADTEGFGGGFGAAGRPGFGKKKKRSKDSTGGFNLSPLDSSKLADFKEARKYQPSKPSWLPKNIRNGSIKFEFDSGGAALHEKFSQIVLSRDGKYAALAGNNMLDNSSQLFVFDLTAGTVVAEKEFSAREVSPFAFSPDGSKLAIKVAAGMSNQTGLHLWEFGGGELTFSKGWLMETAPLKANFVSDSRLVSIDFFGAVLIDVEKDKILAKIEADAVETPAGGTIYGAEGSHNTYAIDFTKGTFFKFNNDLNYRLGSSPAISASGRFLAHKKKSVVEVLDLSNGNSLSQFSAGAPQFVGDRYVFGNDFIFDAKLGAPVVELELERNAQSFAFTEDGTALYVARGQSVEDEHTAWLVVSNLLTPALRERISGFTVGKPIRIEEGSQISLNLSGVNKPVVTRMKKAMAKQGLQVVENSDLQLLSENKVLPTESREVGFRRNGENDVATISFTPTVSHIYLTYKGKRLWGKTRTNRPGTYMRGEPGENPQTTATRLSRPDPKFFENSNFPTRIVLYPGTMPKLKISAQGIR